MVNGIQEPRNKGLTEPQHHSGAQCHFDNHEGPTWYFTVCGGGVETRTMRRNKTLETEAEEGSE